MFYLSLYIIFLCDNIAHKSHIIGINGKHLICIERNYQMIHNIDIRRNSIKFSFSHNELYICKCDGNPLIRIYTSDKSISLCNIEKMNSGTNAHFKEEILGMVLNYKWYKN